MGDRVSLNGQYESIQLRVSGVFETGVSEIDKNRIYLHLNTARRILGHRFGGSVFQLALQRPDDAPEIAVQLQSVLGHRVVSWQRERKSGLMFSGHYAFLQPSRFPRYCYYLVWEFLMYSQSW